MTFRYEFPAKLKFRVLKYFVITPPWKNKP